MTPSASAASVPMRMGMCQSARWAVRLRRGSMTITCTPFLRASSTLAHRCTLVAIRSAPQETIRSDWVMDSGSAPPTGPTVRSQAVSQQVSHTVPPCRRLVPSAWNRPLTSPRFICPWWAL